MENISCNGYNSAYVKTEKMASSSTIYGYRKEVEKFADYINSINITDVNLISFW
jgi:site-specific recombinase XerD